MERVNLFNDNNRNGVMRAQVLVTKISKGPLPWDYQYAMASMLYGKIAVGNIRLANMSHSARKFKFYDFSNLIIGQRRKAKEGLAFKDAKFVITSPDVEFIKSFAEGLLQEPNFQLKGEQFVVTQIEILKERKLRSLSTFKTLSPIFVKTVREKDGRLLEWDLYPKDGKFYENIHKNLVARYTEYCGRAPHDYFEITDVKKFKPKRVVMGGGPGKTPRRCSLMTFTVQASDELIQFAYDAGIGEKTAMGFGCLEVVG